MTKMPIVSDGVDHIHVSVFGKTPIGKLCSIDFNHEFAVPGIGDFVSPAAFAYWVLTGTLVSAAKQHKFKLPPMKKEVYQEYKKILFLGKFFQMTELREILTRDSKAATGKMTRIDLPFFIYKVHASGLKEILPDQRDAETTKAMLKFIIDPDEDKGHFQHPDFDYIQVLASVNRILKQRHVKILDDMRIALQKESIHQAHEALIRREGIAY